MTVRELIASGHIHRGEAETLLAAVLGVDRAWLFAHGDDRVAKATIDRFNELTLARREGEPLAYLLFLRFLDDSSAGESARLDPSPGNRASRGMGDRADRCGSQYCAGYGDRKRGDRVVV